MIALKIIVAVALFMLFLTAPSLMAFLLLSFVMYVFADIIVELIFNKNNDD